MDITLKQYFYQLIHPLFARIQALQISNKQLKAQVRHLQQLFNYQPAYQRPTLSANQHTRESRISSKDTQLKKPAWNSNTKYQSPQKQTHQLSYQKVKTKSPIPKIVKSSAKAEKEEGKSNGSGQKISSGLKVSADTNSHNQIIQNYRQSSISSESKRQNRSLDDYVDNCRNNGNSAQPDNNKFEQLLKKNTEIVQQMKKQGQKTKQQTIGFNYLPMPKVAKPKSARNPSTTASPNSRSSLSQAENKKGLQLNINIDGQLAKIEIK